MERAEFRLPSSLKNRVLAECDEDGVDFSEYTRQALAVRLAWAAAVKAIKAGADPDELLDLGTVVERLTGEKPPSE